MLKILIADKFPTAKLEELRSLPVKVDYQPGLKAEQLKDALKDTNILCVRSTEVQADALAVGKHLMLIVRVGSGTNTIDVKEASRRGIFVTNCPGKNAVAVAELTMGLLLAIDRRIPQATAAIKQNDWNKKEFSQADGVKGKRFGLAGFGRIGRAVARRAEAFEMEVAAWDIALTPTTAKEEGIEYCETLDQLCQTCDVISVHLPLLPQTRHLFDKERFAMMKPGAIFLNTSRGELHNQTDLIEAMQSRGLRVGLDVFLDEPDAAQATFETPFAQQPGFVGTPHIGASTEQAQSAVADEAIRIIRCFLTDGEVPNCVNLEQHSDVRCQLIVRHYDKVGVLASILNLLQEANINIEEMSNTIFQGAQTAVASMSLSQVPPDDLLTRLEQMTDKIIQATVVTPIEAQSPTE